MDNRIAAQLYLDIKNGKDVPRKTKQVLIGFLQSVKERHKHGNRFEDMNKITQVIKEIKESGKPIPQKDKLL